MAEPVRVRRRSRPPVGKTLADRWWLRVLVTESCWLWTGGKWLRGYGRFSLPGGKRVAAHRWGYEHLVGPVGAGLELDHLCRNHGCVNPAHLEPVTHTENVRRGRAGEVTRARLQAITSCPAGHPYDDANTYRASRGSRMCRACQRLAARQRRRAAAA